ncbi:hypothetical protein BO71DRAFT_62210 [Aspergillus ellipticus CBS 707.79]|uniref:Uncharacterized protein n=1 Tax=Aspergillus ellipticus CBS 707.79 TaxID=1448320 RepID=A0A319D8W9_9EURO|nr:hypothetical protein BO71DRAFT_62210 [Aspergillus ellipticus CBS 707.79]
MRSAVVVARQKAEEEAIIPEDTASKTLVDGNRERSISMRISSRIHTWRPTLPVSTRVLRERTNEPGKFIVGCQGSNYKNTLSIV